MADETPVDERPAYKETPDGRVLVPLVTAHPLARVYAERCQAEDVRDYKVGDTIYVSREWGNALIDAGMVQIDPVDPDARKAALLLNRRMAPLTVKEIEAKLGGGEQTDAAPDAGDADAATGASTQAGGESSQGAAVRTAKSAAKA